MKNHASRAYRPLTLFLAKSFPFLLAGLALNLAAHLAYSLVKPRQNQILIFILYLLSLLIPWGGLLFKKGLFSLKEFGNGLLRSSPVEKTALLLFTGLLIFTRFLYLKELPFVGVWDPLRDGGLLPQQVAQGVSPDLFGNGPLLGWGRLLLGFTSQFYHIFGNTIYTIRVPAALASLFWVPFFSLFLWKVTRNRSLVLWGTLLLACNTQHLHFARNELLIVLDGLLMTAICFHWYYARTFKTLRDYLLLGLCLGFSFNFHVALWPVILIVTLFTVFPFFYSLFIPRRKRSSPLGIQGAKIFLFLLFFTVGVGPRLQKQEVLGLLQCFDYSWCKIPLLVDIRDYYEQKQGKVVVGLDSNPISIYSGKMEVVKRLWKKVDFMDYWTKYKKSLMVYFYEKAVEHTHDYRPFLPFLLGPFFLLGLGVIFFGKGDPFGKILGSFIFILPFTNSAATDLVNYDHRIFVLLPICLFFTALGISFALEKRPSLPVWGIFVLILYPVFDFFYFARDNKKLTPQDFLVQHAIYLIKEKLEWVQDYKRLCFLVPPDVLKHLQMDHIKEQMRYFLHPLRYKVFDSPLMPFGTLHIAKECPKTLEDELFGTIPDPEMETFMGSPLFPGLPLRRRTPNAMEFYICKNYNKLLCPADHKGEVLRIFVDRGLFRIPR